MARFAPLALCAALTLASPLADAGQSDGLFTQSILHIETADGVSHRFEVEVAANDQARAMGLMFRKSMLANAGMLFDFEEDRYVTMWMKNTILPLDMLFIRADGTVARIAEHTEPFSTKTIPSGAKVRSVLELNAGTAARLGIHRGDRVVHEIFGNDGG